MNINITNYNYAQNFTGKVLNLKITNTVRMQLEEMLEKDLSYDAIAKFFNIPKGSVNCLIQKCGYQDIRKNKFLQRNYEILKMRDQGFSVKQIADKYGIGATAVYTISKRTKQRNIDTQKQTTPVSLEDVMKKLNFTKDDFKNTIIF